MLRRDPYRRINACWSGDPRPTANTQAFINAFKATAYVGWNSDKSGTFAVGAAGDFFPALDGNKTVAQATAAAIAGFPARAGLTAVVGGNTKIDLTP